MADSVAPPIESANIIVGGASSNEVYCWWSTRKQICGYACVQGRLLFRILLVISHKAIRWRGEEDAGLLRRIVLSIAYLFGG